MVKLCRMKFSVEDLHDIVVLRYGFNNSGPPIRSLGAISKMTGVKVQTLSLILLRYQRNGNRCIIGRRRNGRARITYTQEQEDFLLDLNALRSFGLNHRCLMYKSRFGQSLSTWSLRKFYR